MPFEVSISIYFYYFIFVPFQKLQGYHLSFLFESSFEKLENCLLLDLKENTFLVLWEDFENPDLCSFEMPESYQVVVIENPHL